MTMLEWVKDNLLTSGVRAALVALIIAVMGAITEALTSAVQSTGSVLPVP